MPQKSNRDPAITLLLIPIISMTMLEGIPVNMPIKENREVAKLTLSMSIKNNDFTVLPIGDRGFETTAKANNKLQ